MPRQVAQRCLASLRSPAVAAAASPQRADALRWIIGRLAALQLATGALEEAAAHYKQLVQLDPSALSGASGSCGFGGPGSVVGLVEWAWSCGRCSRLPPAAPLLGLQALRAAAMDLLHTSLAHHA